MMLPPHELALFFRLHRTLMFFVNQRLKVIPNQVASPDEFSALPPEVRAQVRDALNANLDLIEAFTAENPADLSDEELDIVRSWRHLVTDTGAAKAAAIRKMFKIYELDPNWTLPSRLDDNPMVWMLQVDGFIIDVRNAPREVQEIAFEKGLIPYIPADRREGE